MAKSATFISRTGEELEYPNAENIRKANEAREARNALLQAQSERQRKINYKEYSETGNHVVRSKGVRQAVTMVLALSKDEQDEVLQLVNTLR